MSINENTKTIKATRAFGIRQIVLCALFTALIAVGGFIKIPVPPIPFTLQTMFVCMAGMLLGARLGGISALLYMVLGLIGLPIFTAGGGIGYVLKPSFGYIIGFCFAAYVTGRISFKGGVQGSIKRLFCATLAGLGVTYVFGLVYYWALTNFVTHSYPGFWLMILHCFLMTIPGDLVTCFIACIICKRVYNAAKKYLE